MYDKNHYNIVISLQLIKKYIKQLISSKKKITLLFKNGCLNSMWDCSVIISNEMQGKHA